MKEPAIPAIQTAKAPLDDSQTEFAFEPTVRRPTRAVVDSLAAQSFTLWCDWDANARPLRTELARFEREEVRQASEGGAGAPRRAPRLIDRLLRLIVVQALEAPATRRDTVDG